MRAWLVKVNGKVASLHRFQADAKEEASTWRQGCRKKDCPECGRIEIVRLRCIEEGT